MKFMKVFWAALLAFFVANILIWTFVIMIISGISAIGSSIPTVANKSVLYIDLSDGIRDSPSSMPVRMSGLGVYIDRSNTILQVVNAIERSAYDDNIEGIYINLKGNQVSLSNLEELRAALVEFKESGKFVVSYSEGYAQMEYYLASLCDRVYMNPKGGMTWSGLTSNVIFYKGLLDKLGLEPEIIRVGTFKAAVEPFLLDKMSPENRLQTSVLLNTVWGAMLHDISASRGIDSAVLSNYATELALRTAGDAVQYGFVDGLLYQDQVMEILGRVSAGEELEQVERDVMGTTVALVEVAEAIEEGAQGEAMEEVAEQSNKIENKKEWDNPKFITLDKYITATDRVGGSMSKNVVAIVYADGGIVSGPSSNDDVGSETLSEKLAKVRDNDKIKALVLRVNSPGGSALASEVMWREVELIRKIKPVIVSMGSMAASGGYYISAPGDMILANRTTLTGSIGVFGLMINASKGLKDKLGVTVDMVRTNPSSDMGSMFRALTPRERQYIMYGVEEVYTTFVDHVAKGRNMSVEQVDKIGGGRVWSGVSALEIGLIDGFGGIKDAIALAADRAGVAEDYRVRQMIDEPDNMMVILKSLMDSGIMSKMVGQSGQYGELGEMMMHYNAVKEMATEQGVQARVPYMIEIK